MASPSPTNSIIGRKKILSAKAVGARLIAPDRPGYGLSQPDTHSILLGYVTDIVELVDALQLESFAVLGISGGGPYPLACARQIPRRITDAALISAIGPLRLPHSTRHMLRMNRIMFNLGRLSPRLVGVILPRLIRTSLPSMKSTASRTGA